MQNGVCRAQGESANHHMCSARRVGESIPAGGGVISLIYETIALGVALTGGLWRGGIIVEDLMDGSPTVILK